MAHAETCPVCYGKGWVEVLLFTIQWEEPMPYYPWSYGYIPSTVGGVGICDEIDHG